MAAQLTAMRAAGEARAFDASDGLPQTVEEAYAVARQCFDAKHAVDVASYKLGGTTPGTQAAFATETAYFGALAASEIWTCGEARPIFRLPDFRGEAEIAVRLARDVSAEEVADLVADDTLFDAFAPALEAPWSVVRNLPEAGLPALLMDCCAVGLLFLGTPRPIDAAAMEAPLAIVVEGEIRAEGKAATGLVMPPMAAALAGMKEMARYGMRLAAGQWISTGGITPCVDLPHGVPAELRFGGVPEFQVVVERP
ncbi:hypothetical protein [Acuticoccus mangrovi]|uniref:2-keto-4-pentenoate hydratase n=1 Tax=Acuticoccus mangrovi TaxID=2796142 RepID=A0A934ILE5_9HYPH|nr:hypothetical protein [Acuticoccus mangrovi]MBJ3778774.1 hypothetical protein [Acuticoccus mangrovi]